MTRETRYNWLRNSAMAICLCVVAACTDDTEPTPDDNLMQVVAVTRASDELQTEPVNTNGTQIKVFLTTDDNSQTQKVTTGQFSLSNNRWTSSVGLKENVQYYVYGFMPANVANATLSDNNNDYSDGVTMTMSGLPAITDQDVCMLIGIQRVTSADATKEDWTKGHAGTFGYLSGSPNTNYAYLLMDHLYAALQFQFNVNEYYASLRTIHLKEVTLKSKYSTIDATVPLRAGIGISTVTYSNKIQADKTVELLKSTDPEVILPVETATPSAIAVGAVLYGAPDPDVFDTAGNSISIVCKFDVYDNNVTTSTPNGNLVRANCVAENKLKLNSAMVRGKKRVLTLTVNPTYLYQLSEPDLDNPTVSIE